MRNDWQSKYKNSLEEIGRLKEDTDHWMKRAMIAETQIKETTSRSELTFRQLTDTQNELEEVKKRLPQGHVMTHLENIVRLNDTYQRMLFGDGISFWQKVRLVFKR